MAKPRLVKVRALFYVLQQVMKRGCIGILIHPRRLTNFVLLMYNQLIPEQRSQIFALLQSKTEKKLSPALLTLRAALFFKKQQFC